MRVLTLRAGHAIPVFIALLVGYLALVPLGYLLWGTFFDDDGFTLARFSDAYSDIGLAAMALDSLWFALGSTAVAVVTGTALAFLTVRTDLPLRRTVFALALVPMLIPGVLYTIAWILAGSGRIGALRDVPGSFDVFGLGGMVLVEGFHLAPLVLLLMAAALRSQDPALEEAALSSGARPATVVRRITLPVVAPAIYASILVSAIRALESFEVPVLLGIPDGTWVFTSRIWRAFAQVPADLGEAGAHACVLLLITAAGVFAYSRLTRRTARFQTIAGGAQPRRMALGRWRPVAAAGVGALLLVTTVLPVAMLLYASVLKTYSSPVLGALPPLTLDHYGDALGGEASLRAFRNSLLLGVGTATAVMGLMAVLAWITVRSRARGRWLLDALATAPVAIPGLVLALAVLFVYLRLPVGVYATLWILLIAYVTRFMPHGMRFASATMAQLAGDLEESARVSGASWWQTFRRVVAPLALPGLAAGWLYVFILSMRELSSSVILYSPGNEVVPVLIWQRYQDGALPGLAAIGVVLIAVLGLLGALAWRLSVRSGLLRGAG